MSNNNKVNTKINKIEIRIGTLNLTYNGGQDQPDNVQIAEIKSKPVNHPVAPSYYPKYDYKPNIQDEKKETHQLRNALTTAQAGAKATNEINKSLRQGLNDTSAKVLEQKEVIERQKKVIESLEKESKKREDEMDDKIHKMKACIELCKSYHQLASELEKKFDNLQVAMDKLFR